MCKAANKTWSHYTPHLQGTWAHPQVAVHLAQWLSPQFAVLVTQWITEWMSGKYRTELLFR